MTTGEVVRDLSRAKTRDRIKIVGLAPFALLAAYYMAVFAAYGLQGGDLDYCPRSGKCQSFAGPLHADPWSAAVMRWHTWSGRFTLELVEYALSHTLWLFAFVTIALSWLFLWAARSLLQIRGTGELTVMAGLVFALVPLQFHVSAGVYSTVICYSWTAFLGIFAVAVVVRLIRREPTNRWLVAATVPALVFALCSEQFAVAFAFAVAALAYHARNRRDLRQALGLYAGLLAVALLNAALAPGNQIRKASEIAHWMPQFATMSLIDKFSEGLRHALYLFAQPSIPAAFLAAALAVILLAHARSTGSSVIPGAAVLLWLAGIVVAAGLGINLGHETGTTVACVALLAVPAVRGGAQVTRHDPETRTMIASVLAAGFSSAMLMSISPTVWASDTRTLLLEHLALVASVFLLGRCAWRLVVPAGSPGTGLVRLRRRPDPS